MKYLEKIDLSSYRTIATVFVTLCLLIVGSADLITTMLTSINLPDVYQERMGIIRFHTWFVASLLAIPVVSGLLWLIHRTETLRRELEHVVRLDDLTGLLSREAFLEDFRNECAQPGDDVSDAFLIVDADFFKKINDSHGHIAGDRALVAITDALSCGIRDADRIGRLGGEEFAIHLRGVDKDKAMEIAERLRTNVMAASGNAEIPDLKLSVSIGAVFYDKKQDIVSLLTAADQQLYLAKGNGRNRVEFEHCDAMTKAA
ncbi:MAG: GGDEF domain-containing protein [Rhizobiaceae bacterium]